MVPNSIHKVWRQSKFRREKNLTKIHGHFTQTLFAAKSNNKAMEQNPTKLEYFDDMSKLQSTANLLRSILSEDGRQALLLDSTIFHPQGGGQPSDTGFIFNPLFNFIVQDVRSKYKIVYHYGHFENSKDGALEDNIEKGVQVCYMSMKLGVGSILAGHLLDICVRNVGWDHLEPSNGYRFADGPYVEYKGSVPQHELETMNGKIELEANNFISTGGKVLVAIVTYDKASQLCGGSLLDYIPKDSTPRIVKFGENLGCPCGGTHVNNMNEILNITVSQIRTRKGLTSFFMEYDA